jgi:uncharacterized oligopeptide transporter (OPT) family protein
MNYLLTHEEQGPVSLDTWKLILWSLGLCSFGVLFSVPLFVNLGPAQRPLITKLNRRRQVILRERLRFPSGFSTAVLIGVLHGQSPISRPGQSGVRAAGAFASLAGYSDDGPQGAANDQIGPAATDEPGTAKPQEWTESTGILVASFAASGILTLGTYFFPPLRSVPVFGSVAADTWLWTFNPSLAYIGQGIIMGPETTLHMLLGAVVGWAVLSPLAYYKGWAPGPIDDWESGSKGWVVWVSLSIMLADSVVSLGYIIVQSLVRVVPDYLARVATRVPSFRGLDRLLCRSHRAGYNTLPIADGLSSDSNPASVSPPLSPVPAASPVADVDAEESDDEKDAPPEQLINEKVVSIGLVLSVILCVGTIRIVFGQLVPLYATIIAVAMALLLSIMGVRALGETDLNPVSGISKLAQLCFAIIIPPSNKSSVLINLVAGAVVSSEWVSSR